jgi:hypothetical protein
VLGALEDPNVHSQERLLIANVGNFTRWRFGWGRGIEGVEHHTGELTRVELETYLQKLPLTLIHQECLRTWAMAR